MSSDTMLELRDCPAPAKLNLFLHVVGRREDGYHLIESVFQLIDLADTLHFKRRDDGRVMRMNASASMQDVPEDADLTIRAARLLQTETGCTYGVEISIEKYIPLGGGLGGGSSDAATTLLALNQLWQLHLPRAALMRLGLKLGADVPFFLFGRNAFVHGIGEQLLAIEADENIEASCFIVIHPGVAVPTAAIFSAPELTRNSESLRISDFSAKLQKFLSTQALAAFKNDLEDVAVRRFPEVGKALKWLKQRGFGQARMSGSGACVFCQIRDQEVGQQLLDALPAAWNAWVCQGLAEHPLLALALD